MNHHRKPKIVVIGGAVMDFVFPVHELPSWQQAVQAHDFRMFPGGKGLNQAVAAARLGGEVSLISAVGEDEFGQRIIDYLELERISYEHVQKVKNGYTDVTGVFVNESGESAFVGWKGLSNTQITIDDIEKASSTIASADAILITFETPLNTIEEAVNTSQKSNSLVILNPAPPLDLLEPTPYSLLENVDVLIPNLWEACQLARKDADPKNLASQLHGMGIDIVYVTNSEYGCAVATKGQVREYPAYLVGKPVDTTGGSDAFCAAIALCLINKLELEEATQIAISAATIALTKRGGAPSMPTLTELNRFLKLHGITAKLPD